MLEFVSSRQTNSWELAPDWSKLAGLNNDAQNAKYKKNWELASDWSKNSFSCITAANVFIIVHKVFFRENHSSVYEQIFYPAVLPQNAIAGNSNSDANWVLVQ